MYLYYNKIYNRHKHRRDNSLYSMGTTNDYDNTSFTTFECISRDIDLMISEFTAN